MISAILMILMLVIGFGLPLVFAYAIHPALVAVLVAIYLLPILIGIVRVLVFKKWNEFSLEIAIFAFPLMLGCIVVAFVGGFLSYVPIGLHNFYINSLKAVYRRREAASRIPITAQNQLDELPSGYRFSIGGMIDKNASGRKGKVVYRISNIYLGASHGWMNDPQKSIYLPYQLSIDTGEGNVIIQQSKYRSSSLHKLTIEPIPEEAHVPDDVEIGTRHEWEIWVGDDIEILGQASLQYYRGRSPKKRTTRERRIKYESLQVVHPRKWELRQPDEDDIRLATQEVQKRERDANLKLPIQSIDTIAQFMVMPAGQRFTIDGIIDSSSQQLWHDYVYYQPIYHHSRYWKHIKPSPPTHFQYLTIKFADGMYIADFKLRHYTYYGTQKHVSIVRKQPHFTIIEFPPLDIPEDKPDVNQDGEWCYNVLKVGDPITLHGQMLTKADCEEMDIPYPAITVEKLTVRTQRDWVFHPKDDRPAHEYWSQALQRQIDSIKKIPVPRTKVDLSKKLGLSAPPRSTGYSSRAGNPNPRSRFGRTHSTNSFKKKDSDEGPS